MAETAYAVTMREKRKETRKKLKNRGSRNLAVSGGAKCGAKRKKGGTCHLAAGFGTEHTGFGRCKFHGGAAPNGRLNAAKQEAIFMGAPKEINPVEALIWCVHVTAGEVEWYSERLAEIRDKNEWYEDTVIGKQMNILARERAHATERLARFSKDAISLGLAERAVRIAEQYGVALARLLRGVMEDLELTAEQQKRAPGIIRKHLILLESRQQQLELPSAEKAA